MKTKALLFLACCAITLFFLFLGTGYETYVRIWNNEGRAYDTMLETNVLKHAVEQKRKAYANGAESENVRIKIYDFLANWSYARASQKVPPDDFEQKELFYYFNMRSQAALKAENSVDADKVIPFVHETLKQRNNIHARSAIVRDVEYHTAISNFSLYYLIAGKQILKEEFDPKIAIEAIYHSAMTTDFIKQQSYIAINPSESTFATLYAANLVLIANMFPEQSCDAPVATKWLKVNEKTSLYLDKYWKDEDFKGSAFQDKFRSFKEQYPVSSKGNLERIAQHCAI